MGGRDGGPPVGGGGGHDIAGGGAGGGPADAGVATVARDAASAAAPDARRNETPPHDEPFANLLENPGFEQGMTGWVRIRGTGGLMSPGYQGQGRLDEPSSNSWWQQHLSGWQPGALHRVSAWGRSPGGKCRVGIKGGTSSGPEFRYELMPFEAAWSQRTLDAVVPPDTSYLQLFITSAGDPGCSFDELGVARAQ